LLASEAGGYQKHRGQPREFGVRQHPRAREAQRRDELGRMVEGGIVTKELWLRIHDDGREECYDHDPAPIRALHVVVTDGVEETWTSDRQVRPGWREPVPPPGRGWKAAGGDGNSTLWRRVTDGIEEMWTSDREVRPGWHQPVPPPGEGWEAAGGTGGKTLWRRTRLEP
jgi:hypothetical protein